MKPAKILFFVDGPAPSPEDFAEAAELKATVVFRNARAVPSEPHSLEICDGVAGKVPAIYDRAYPDADEAIEIKAKELKALTSKVGDAPAPKQGKKTEAAKPADPAADATAKQGEGKAPAWNPNAAS